MRTRTFLAVLAAVGALLAPGVSATACATGHLGVRWITFQAPINDFGPVFFYHAVEPPTTTNLPITIQGTGDDCSGQPVVGTYQVADPPAGTSRVATSGLDYSAIFPPRTTAPLYGYHAQGQTEHGDTVPVVGDALPETVVEQAQALITGSTGRRDFPFDVPFYILDDDGTDRVSFERGGPYERSETYGSISVPVFRAGPATAAADFALTAAGSSANPATAGEDYVPPPGTVSFSPGERVKLIKIEITNDGRFEPAEELTLRLTEPGAVLPDDPVAATVRILDSIGASGLESRLHHPRERYTYRASDFRIREVHIFTSAGAGAPVTAAEFALRRNDKGGKCKWWVGKRFKAGDCQNERWLETGRYEPDFFYYRLEELAPSKGKIKDYSAFARAKNDTNEIETFLEKGRNANTFEVKKPAKK